MRITNSATILLLLFLVPGPLAHAQATNASISGLVRDQKGAVVPGAAVTVVQIDTNLTRSSRTDESGQYSISFLPVGAYRLEVDAVGFKKFQQAGIVLEVGRSARLDVLLQVGAIEEAITVTGDAPLVNTTNASIGRTVNNREIVNLPLVNRDLYALLNLTPGVDASVASSVGSFEPSAVVNGSPNSMGAVSYNLDGGNNANPVRNTGAPLPDPDAVQEFRVITNNFGADFGRFGGGVIDVVTKSGTNSFHGSLFEFLRNDALNARPWNASTKPSLRRNQFGGTVGGPVVKDRTFFFGSYSGLRQREAEFKNSAIVPTAAERRGDFSASSRKPRDPVTNQAFPNNTIPLGRFDPTARRILEQSVPLANLPGQFFEVTEPHPQDFNEYQFKVDHALAASHQLTGSYFQFKGQDTVPLTGNLPWSIRHLITRQRNVNVSETWTISSTTINQLRVTYMRIFTERVNLPATSLGDFGSKFQVQGTPSLPQIAVSGFFTLGQAIAGPKLGGHYYGLRETLSLIRGRHSLKVGGEVSLDKVLHYTDLNNYGTFQFDGSKTGNAVADFLLGLPRTMNQDAPIDKIDNGWYSGLFIQDDFRIHPRLTLNVGLRYDLQFPMLDPKNRKVTFVAGQRSRVIPSAPLGLLFPGDPGLHRGVVETDRNNFAPRFGFAWDPTGSGKMAIRAAAGVFYGSISGNVWNQVADRQPFTVRQQFNNVRSLTDPYGNLPGGVSPYPYIYNPTNPLFLPEAAISGISLDYRWPYTYQLNFSIQREFFRDVSVMASYVGTLAHKFPFAHDVNYPVFGPGATAANVNQRRPFEPGRLSTVQLVESSMNSAYHGLQLTVEKRLSHSLSFKGYYTFSKTIDSVDLENAQLQVNAQNHTRLFLERGRASLDRTHNFVLGGIWELNYLRGSHPVLRALGNNWSLSGIISVRSGQPLSITSGRDNNLDGNNNDRANLIGDPFLSANRSRNEVTARWFNTSAFEQNATGKEGTSGRNILDGPGLKIIDMALFRDFRLTESVRLQFRAEMTNALNLVNLENPTLNMNSLAVGTIRTARQMRQTQLGLRLSF